VWQPLQEVKNLLPLETSTVLLVTRLTTTNRACQEKDKRLPIVMHIVCSCMKKSSRLCSHRINHGQASDGICNLKGEGHIALLDKRGLSAISMLGLFALEKPIQNKTLFCLCQGKNW
jgi:hypothetical protein